MQYKTLRYVLTIARERSFSKAAEELYISQPSLSQTINLLEKDLGGKIFDRSTVPLTLTYLGERYVAAAAKILEIENQLTREIDEINQNLTGRLTIGMSYARVNKILPHVLPPFHAEFPNVNVVLTEGHHISQINMLKKGAIDLAFMNAYNLKELASVPLIEEEVMLAVPKDHSVCRLYEGSPDKYPAIDLAKLKEETFILFCSEHGVRQLSNKIFTDYGFSPKVNLELFDMELSHSMTRQGLGLSFALKTGIQDQEENGLRYFRFSRGQYKYNYSICHRKGVAPSPVAKRFIELSQEAMQKM